MSKKNENRSAEEPLKNTQWEKFANLVVDGVPQGDAYMQSGFKSKDKKSAHSGASRLRNTNPEVKDRIMFLQLQKLKGNNGEITPDFLIQRLETILCNTSSPQDFAKALSQYDDMTGILDVFREQREGRDNRPDPSAILEYVCGFAGRSGAEIVKELGGASFIAGRLAEILGVPVTIDGVEADND
ncbi:hypothetical protein [Pontiella sulfatireligans]|uniref:Terminase small subunit n=1 Tax=Pontiella sulfatireligans TaxID=2750658 RepID=A0A6C2UMA4_9BACT|nr:hypothetical protein [Pontiella sulfatireligans]VGO21129.1 hypothetical protein SCARR_03199 [Pontiella sulfatireligans]